MKKLLQKFFERWILISKKEQKKIDDREYLFDGLWKAYKDHAIDFSTFRYCIVRDLPIVMPNGKTYGSKYIDV